MISATDLGLEVVKSSGGEELVLCPFHSDRKPSSWFDPRKGLFWCAVCNIGLNVRQLCEKLNLQFDEVEAYASETTGLEDLQLVDEVGNLDLGVELYHDYMRDRNISQHTISSYGVRWREFPQSVVFPIRNSLGRVIGASYRYLSGPTRYRIIGEPTPVWPLPMLSENHTGGVVIVTEGAFSAMRLSQFTADFVLCLLGAKANRKVIETLRPFRAIFLFDGDSAGRRACLRMREDNPLAQAYTLSKSPDDMEDSELIQLVQKIEAKI